jgi:hypothetical protein
MRSSQYFLSYQDNLELFQTWLREMGGSFDFTLTPDPPRSPDRYKWPPKYKPFLRSLDPKKYTVDSHGSIRRTVQKMD